LEAAFYMAVQWAAIGFLSLMLALALFEPALPYKFSSPPTASLDSPEFLRVLGALAGGQVHEKSHLQVLTNADVYYPAELEAIAQARHSVNLEAYIFKRGEVTRRFLAALIERARAGVQVNVVVDAVGSFTTWPGYFKELRAAGGRVHFYHPIRWYTLPRINNRTHRELIIVDGTVGFIGGAGFADYWLKSHGPRKRKRPWRDTMVRVEGEAVRDLQSVFAENWLETSGEVLADHRYFPCCPAVGDARTIVVRSTPSAGRAARNRMLFQMLLASARKSIHITTPYFLPDRSARAELVRAARERRVEVKIIVPGRHIDHLITQASSRRLWGRLLRAGIGIHQYGPAMIHTKALIVDGLWSVVGSTNFDSRSFGINDEVNLAISDPVLAARLEEDFARDLAASKTVNYRRWLQRPFMERAHELIGRILERQQ
jgi:cardiolipin synthase